MKTIIRSTAILTLMFVVAYRTYVMAGHAFTEKLVEYAEKHPEMTLAELLFDQNLRRGA